MVLPADSQVKIFFDCCRMKPIPYSIGIRSEIHLYAAGNILFGWLQGCLSDSFTRKFNQQNQITINCHPFLQVGLFSTRQKSDLPERSNFNPDRQINPYATI